MATTFNLFHTQNESGKRIERNKKFNTKGGVVQSLSCIWLLATPWTAAYQASLSFTIFQSLLKLTSIESVITPSHLILCRPSSPFALIPSIRIFSEESALRISWSKYWSFSFSVSPCNEYSELISFRIDWFDLLAVQEIQKSILQHHYSEMYVCMSVIHN